MMPIPSPTATMDPSTTLPTRPWLSCLTPQPPSITPSCSRMAVLTTGPKTLFTQLRVLYRRNGQEQERRAWRPLLVRHQESSRPHARRHRNRDRIRASRARSMEGTIIKTTRLISNSRTSVVQRVRRLLCRVRCSTHKLYRSGCRQAPLQCFHLHLRPSRRRHRPFPPNMAAETTPPRTEVKPMRRACHMQVTQASRTIPQLPQVIQVPL